MFYPGIRRRWLLFIRLPRVCFDLTVGEGAGRGKEGCVRLMVCSFPHGPLFEIEGS